MQPSIILANRNAKVFLFSNHHVAVVYVWFPVYIDSGRRMMSHDGGFRLRPSECIFVICLMMTVAAFTAELNDIPASAFSLKTNSLNRVVVGFGWGIVVVFESAQLILTTSIIGGKDWPLKLRRPILRLLVSTALWYVITGSMTSVRDNTGHCLLLCDAKEDGKAVSITKSSPYRQCLKGGGQWTGHDASGHIFLLTFNTLMMVEEAAAFNVARQLRYIAPGAGGNSELKLLQRQFDEFKWLLVLFTGANYALLAVWGWTMLMTSFYFHTFLEKVIGFLVALLAWHVVYNALEHVAGKPGVSELNSQLHRLVGIDDSSSVAGAPVDAATDGARHVKQFWMFSTMSLLASLVLF